MSSTAPKTTASTAKPLKSVSKPKATTGDSKVLPKKKTIAPETKKAQSAGTKKPEPTYNYGDDSIRVYAGPTKTAATVTSKASATISSANPPKTTQPKPKAPLDAPIQIKKKPLDKRPIMHDYRSVSTSTTTSNASTASTLSTISSASSVSSTSAVSTETIKASKNNKPKAVTAPKSLGKTQEVLSTVTAAPKKAIGDKLLPVKQKKDVVAKPTTTNIQGQPQKSIVPEKPLAKKAPLPKKIARGPEKPEVTAAGSQSRLAEPIEAKPAKVVTKTASSADATAAVPPVKKTALKPKPVAKLAGQDKGLSSDTSSIAPARKTAAPLPPFSEMVEPKTPAGKKSKIIKPSGTVKKTAVKPKAISTTIPAPPAPKPISAAMTAARTAASTPAKASAAAAEPVAKRTVSAPVPPTPKSAKPQKVAQISTTPAPIRTLRPQTERPSARRKSVSFRSPLEAFQIIPARRASASPPKSSSRRHSIASSVASSTRPAPTPMLQSAVLPQVVEEISPRSPPAPTVEDCDDDDDLVFQDEVDERDLITTLSILNEGKPDSVEAKPEADPHMDTEAEKPGGEETAMDEVDAEQPEELAESEEPVPQPPRPQTPWAPAGEDEDEPEDDAPTFDHSEVAPTEAEELDADLEIDDSTVFYDVDESYIPQYSSPRKPGTPRGRLNTPGSARKTKLGKEPRLTDSPKLDLLKLSSPAKRKKMGKVKTRSAPDLRMGMGVKSPLGEEVVA